MTIDASLHNLLASVDTPTVCNAIEVAQGKRGFQGFTRGTVVVAQSHLKAFFGYARTARIRAIAPSGDAPEVVRQRRMDYYRYMAAGPRPAVTVIEDLDGSAAIGAFWGEVNTTVHKGLKLAGAITNGVMRDLDDLAPHFQVLAGSIGPSHGFVHVVDFDTPVSVFGLTVSPGDFVHADRHGAVVVPPEVLPELATAIEKMCKSESFILEPARRPDFDIGKFEQAWAAFEKARI